MTEAQPGARRSGSRSLSESRLGRVINVRFDVLGPLQVSRDGVHIEPGPFKQRSLLALLLIHRNEVASTDRIIDQLWGEDASTDRHGALWVHLSNLRSALEPDRAKGETGSVLLTRSPGYVLEVDDGQIDTGEFENLLREGRALLESDPAAASIVLAEALELWRGRPFEDFIYEEFAQTEINRLDELRMEAVEKRIDADLRSGMDRELIGELEALTREHPLREGFVGQLMLALYRSGRQAEALRSFKALEARLGEELGIGPSVDLRRIEDAILVGDSLPAVDPAGPVPSTGARVRGYELRERIGQGGMAVVHGAFQPSVGREVAIKVFTPEVANEPHFVRRFETESKVVARLEHPCIVPIYDYWREPNGAYLVMRLMRGGSLVSRLQEGPMTDEEAAEMTSRVAGALGAAHEHGIVHGGVNPSNILFDEGGSAYLGDFGVGDTTATVRSDVRGLAALLQAAVEADSPLRDAPTRTAEATDMSSFTETLLGATGKAPGVPDAPTVNPYKGLQPFEETDSGNFYGRERLVERLVNRLGSDAGRFVALVGPSGSGKSSVVKAGLLPALGRGAVAGSEDWYIVQMVPGSHPFEELENALLGVAVSPPPTLLEQLRADEGGLRRVIRRILTDDRSQLLLVIDQFEELFTQTRSEEERRLFLDALHGAANAVPGRLRVVATLRADFYDRPLRYRDFGEMLREGTEVITPMSPEELGRAVAGPAESARVGLEPGLVAAVVSDVSDEHSALPLMQYAMTELFDSRDGAMLTVGAYREIGGVAGALGRRAETVYHQLDADAQHTAKQVFLQLVSLGEDGENTRRRVLLSELNVIGPREAVDRVLDVYGRHRLLSFDRDPVSRGPTVEMAHEALITEWRRFRGWVEDTREDLSIRRRLSDAAAQWSTHDEDPSYLLAGSRLAAAEEWIEATAIAVPPNVPRLVDASSEHLRAEETRGRRRRRLVGSVLGLAAVVAVALLVFGLTQRSAAERLEAVERVNRIIEAAEDALAFDPELTLLLGVAAVEETESLAMEVFPKNLEVLHEGLRADHLLFRVDDVVSAVFSPGGAQVYASNGDGSISVFDANGEEKTVVSTAGIESANAGRLAITPDGRWLTNGYLVIDLEDPNVVEQTWADGHLLFTSPRDVSISRDGRIVAMTDFEPGAPSGTLAVWDRSSGQELWRKELGSPVRVDLHPSGEQVAVASEAGAIEPAVHVFAVASGEEIFAKEDLQAVRGIAFHPEGDRLLLGTDSVVAWTLESGDIDHIGAAHEIIVNDIATSDDSDVVASSDADGNVMVTHLSDPAEEIPLPRHEGGVRAVEVDTTGSRLGTVTGGILGEPGLLLVFDISGKSEDLRAIDTNLPRLSTVDAHPSAGLVAVGADDADGARQLWSTGGDVVLDLPPHAQLGLPLGVNGPIAFSSDGSTIATGDASGNVRLWDAETGALLDDRHIREIAPTMGETFGSMSGFGDHVLAVDFSPDGEHLGMAGAGFVVVANATHLEEGRAVYTHDLGWTDRIDFSPDGQRLLAGANPGRPVDADFTNPVSVIDTASGSTLAQIPLNTVVTSLPVAWSAADDLMAIGSDVITIRDADSYEMLRTLRSESAEIRDLEFHPDGNMLASAYLDGSIVMWDPHRGQRLYRLQGHEGAVADIDWTDNGGRLVSVGDDGIVHIHAIGIEELVELARSRVTRDLTTEECETYLGTDSC